MRIEFLNVWSGKTDKALAEYLGNKALITDVFCFQEADKEFPRIAKMSIRGFNKFEATKFVSEHDIFSQATFVRKGLRTEVNWPVLESVSNVGLGLVTEIRTSWGVYTIVNFHGVSRPGNKLDTEKRLEQSRELIDTFKRATKVIIGGDFNLEKDTESVNMFTQAGFENLNNKFDIRNTRNEKIWEKYPDTKQYYSDWIFTRGVKVEGLEVPYNLVSDHLPMILRIKA